MPPIFLFGCSRNTPFPCGISEVLVLILAVPRAEQLGFGFRLAWGLLAPGVRPPGRLGKGTEKLKVNMNSRGGGKRYRKRAPGGKPCVR